MPTKSRHKATKEAEHFAKKTKREAYFFDWSLGDEPRFQCFFESRHDSVLERIRRCREQRSLFAAEKGKKTELGGQSGCGEFETMLN